MSLVRKSEMQVGRETIDQSAIYSQTETENLNEKEMVTNIKNKIKDTSNQKK